MKIDRHILFEIIRFGVVGVVATLMHYGIYLYLLEYLKINTYVSYITGYTVSFVVNFYLTAYFTFRKAPSFRKGLGFAGAHAVNFLLHMGLLKLFLWIGMSQRYAPIPVFAIAIPINFLLVRFVFKNKKV